MAYGSTQQYEEDQRRRALISASTSPFQTAATRAGQQARSAAMTAGQSSGNAFLGRRLATRAEGQAIAPIRTQQAAMQARAEMQHIANEQARRDADAQRARQLLGGLVGGAGQVLGTVMPMFAPAAGAAGALGSTIGGQPMGAGGGIGQMMGAIGGQPMGGGPGTLAHLPAAIRAEPIGGLPRLRPVHTQPGQLRDRTMGLDLETLRRAGPASGGGYENTTISGLPQITPFEPDVMRPPAPEGTEEQRAERRARDAPYGSPEEIELQRRRRMRGQR